jgi:hypothetical protein
MSERPIIFQGEMVRAIRNGRKTQTRRAIKPVPTFNGGGACHDAGALQQDYVEPHWVFPKTCPYGAPGDLLWVRETWAPLPGSVVLNVAFYRADTKAAPDDVRWRPSIHMPRWASRITLRITDVRVERLQDISEEDAEAEGLTKEIAPNGHVTWHVPDLLGAQTPCRAFRLLWEDINGAGAWDANPWVWVIEFERVKP